MTKRGSKELKRLRVLLHQNSVEFWGLNKDICRYENAIARKNAQIRIKEKLFKVKDIRV